MKKLGVYVIVILLVLVGINLYSNGSNKELSNEELVATRLNEMGINNFDEVECCERIIDGRVCIDYYAYLDGECMHGGYINKDYYTQKYTK